MENKIKRFLSLVLAIVMVAGMMPATILAAESTDTVQSSLVAWYDFNSVDGTTVKDETGNGNDATLLNNATVIEDDRGVGYVMSLSGGQQANADGLSLPVAMFTGINDVTIIMDVKLSSSARWMCLLNAGVSGQQQKYMTFVNEGYDDNTRDENGNLIGQIGLSNATSTSGGGDAEKRIYAKYENKLPTDGTWARVALRHVKSTGEAQIYLGTTKVAEGKLDVTLQELAAEPGCQIRIGSNNIWNDPGLVGLVDNIRIYNRALTEDELGIIPFNAIDTEEELIEALAKGGDVVLGGNITLTQKLTVTTDTTITGPYTLTRAENYTGTLFTVNSGATLTLDGGLVIDGGNEWIFNKEAFDADMKSGASKHPYVTAESGAPVANATMIDILGEVVMNEATIRNNFGSGIYYVADGASLTMNNGAVIDHNYRGASSVVADVYPGGTWTMNAGSVVSNNYGIGNGALSYMKGNMIMNGGKICSNHGSSSGMIMIYSSSDDPAKFATMTMNDGLICHNSVFKGGWGSVIYVHYSDRRGYDRGGTFTMNGGIIEANEGYLATDIVGNSWSSHIYLNGGTINSGTSYSNIYNNYGYVVSIAKDMTINGGRYRIKADSTIDGMLNGELELNGTGISQGADGLWSTSGSGMTIAGTGTVTGDVLVKSTAIATLSSGNFLGDLKVYDGADFTITGGRFGDLEAIKYLAPGLGLAKNADGTYTVTDQVAEVNGEIYNSVAAAESACAEGDTIKMLAIAPAKESIIVDQTTTIELNNNEIYATVEDVYPIFRATADFTVNGVGGVDAMMFGSGYPFIVGSNEAAGNLTINGGKHYGTTTVASVTQGTLNIQGGYYEATPYIDENGVDYGHRYTINCIDANYNSGTAIVNVTGGEFYGFDPDNNLAEGEATDFVPENYASTEHEATVENRLSTWIVTFDAVAYNVQDDQYFGDLSDALDVADAGETVQLLKTWYEELVLVPAGVTFDLNGNVVETENALSFGVVMDGKEEVGGIKIDIDTTKAFTKLQPVNGGYLPIYDTEDGMYKFFAYEVQSNAATAPSSNSVMFYTRVVFDNIEAYNILANTDDSGIDFILNMDWTGMKGFDIRFAMSDGNVKAYAAAAYAQLKDGKTNSKAMTATVIGVDKLGSGAFISAAPCVETIAEVTASAAELVHTIS